MCWWANSQVCVTAIKCLTAISETITINSFYYSNAVLIGTYHHVFRHYTDFTVLFRGTGASLMVIPQSRLSRPACFNLIMSCPGSKEMSQKTTFMVASTFSIFAPLGVPLSTGAPPASPSSPWLAVSFIGPFEVLFSRWSLAREFPHPERGSVLLQLMCCSCGKKRQKS